jgi:uncharacterized protein YbaP (TraB family)
MRTWLVALGLLGSLSAHAQSPVWALHGAHNTVYLAESVHLLKAGDARLPPAFDRAYGNARTIVMELDLSQLDAAAMQSYFLEHATFKGGATLRQALGEQRYRKLSAETERLGLPIEGLAMFEPWAIALMLTDLQYLKLGFDPDQGVERQIERRAHDDGKPIQGLETLEEELGQLEHLSAEQQSRFLELTLDELHESEHETDALLAAWRNGDTQRLAALLSEEYAEFPELFSALVTERNKRWLPQIERFLKDDRDYLVVVGALHLVGKDGLLELARRDGLTPLPLRIN